MCTDMVHQLSKISTRTVHGKDEHADMCGQRADICTDRQKPTWAKITRTVYGKGQRADMCTDGQPRTSYTHRQPQTATDVLCVLADTHRRLVQPTWAKITQTVHGKGQRAGPKDQRADMCTEGQPQTSCVPRGPKSPEQSTERVSVLSPRTNVLICVLMDSHGRSVCADEHTQTATDILCVLTDTHGRPVQPTWAKITRTVHGKGQRVESKDQRADMCTDGQPRTSCPQTATDVPCVLADTHGRPVCTEQTGHARTSCVCWRTPTDILCVLNRQPTWAKITQTVHEKGQCAESKDQRADMCTDGQPRTSYVTNVLICVLMDSHGRPVCAGGHPRTSCHMWAKITQTVHGKGQRAESKDQRADMCTDGQPQTSSTDVLCVLTDTHRRPIQPTWAKITLTVHGKGQHAESKDQLHGKGQRAESKDQHADMCTDGQPRTSCVC
ncbi:unnamed protein product [Brassica rapa]|uniref:Uncharacterized protein n=1 Tax=Brassica campestris TaxID=3711 RepID=A0A8D9D522_BRACM|nr:unnamed protein product [Brassica rapa]